MEKKFFELSRMLVSVDDDQKATGESVLLLTSEDAGHHIGYLTYQWGNILNRCSNYLFIMCMTFILIYLCHFLSILLFFPHLAKLVLKILQEYHFQVFHSLELYRDTGIPDSYLTLWISGGKFEKVSSIIERIHETCDEDFRKTSGWFLLTQRI